MSPPFSSLWRFTADPVITDPGAGRWRWNSNTAPTLLAIANTDEDGNDRNADLETLIALDQVAIRSTTASGNWALFGIVTNTEMGTWHQLEVELVETGITLGLPSNNERTLFDFVRPAIGVIGPISARREEIIGRVASLLHVDSDDVWVAAAVDAAIEYTTLKLGQEATGLPDTPLTVDGLIVFAQRLYTDSPNGAQVAIGDPSFEPIFQPESLWKHVRHYFNLRQMSFGVS